jgi:hypothetical protein
MNATETGQRRSTPVDAICFRAYNSVTISGPALQGNEGGQKRNTKRQGTSVMRRKTITRSNQLQAGHRADVPGTARIQAESTRSNIESAAKKVAFGWDSVWKSLSVMLLFSMMCSPTTRETPAIESFYIPNYAIMFYSALDSANAELQTLESCIRQNKIILVTDRLDRNGNTLFDTIK